MTTTTLAVLVPLLPFLGAAAGLLLGRTAPGFVRPLAVLPPLAALALAALVAVRQGGDQAIDAATELTPTGSVPIELALHIDGFAALVAVLVGLVATCVQIYSTGYLRDDPRYPSYAALVSLFTSAMLLVVYSGDLIVLLVGWEIMGICSYFLVGHYWETPEARAASLKAFLVTKLGDVPFLIGLFALGHRRRLLPHHEGPRHRRGRRTRPPDTDRPAAPGRRGGQVGAVPAAHLAPRRDGGPHTRLRADPRRDDGRRRCLLRRPSPSGLRGLRGRDGRPRRHGRRHDGRLGSRRARPGRHQARPRLLDDRPARLHDRRPRRRRPRCRRLPPPLARRLQGAAVPRGRRDHPRRRHQLAGRHVPDAGPARPCPRRLLDDDRGAPRARRDPALQRLLLQGVRPRRRRARRHRPHRARPRRRGLDHPRRRPRHRRCSPPRTRRACGCWPSTARAPRPPTTAASRSR